MKLPCKLETSAALQSSTLLCFTTPSGATERARHRSPERASSNSNRACPREHTPFTNSRRAPPIHQGCRMGEPLSMPAAKEPKFGSMITIRRHTNAGPKLADTHPDSASPRLGGGVRCQNTAEIAPTEAAPTFIMLAARTDRAAYGTFASYP